LTTGTLLHNCIHATPLDTAEDHRNPDKLRQTTVSIGLQYIDSIGLDAKAYKSTRLAVTYWFMTHVADLARVYSFSLRPSVCPFA